MATWSDLPKVLSDSKSVRYGQTDRRVPNIIKIILKIIMELTFIKIFNC